MFLPSKRDIADAGWYGVPAGRGRDSEKIWNCAGALIGRAAQRSLFSAARTVDLNQRRCWECRFILLP